MSRRTYFLNIPKNIRNFDVSSGGFSGAFMAAAFSDDESEAVEGAVEAGETSREPEDVDAIVCSLYRIETNGISI